MEHRHSTPEIGLSWPSPMSQSERLRMASSVPFIGMIFIGLLPGFLKRAYYRARGAQIGKHVKLGIFSYIETPDLVLGDYVSIAPFTFIRARNLCHIGARSRIHAFTAIDTGALTIGEDSAIQEQVTIGGLLTPRSALTIGDRTKIFCFSFLNPTEPITIGDEVCIGGGSYIFTHGSWQSMLDGFPGKFGPVTIKRGAWLAWRGFVMPNVTIGEEATVGAGSVVTRDIPSRSLAVGTPARVTKSDKDYIRSLSQDEKHDLLLKWLKEFSHYLTYVGRNVQFTQNNDGVSLKVSGTVLVYQRRIISTPSNTDIVMSLEIIDTTLRQTLTKQNCVWFDIASHACRFSTQPLWSDLREFLARYGVRFSVMD